MARVDGQVAGCCALRPLDTVDFPNACEMKRLYVRPAFRGLGLGRALAEAIMDVARLNAYDHVLLDTLDDMEAARTLYEDLGFVEIPPYYHNPDSRRPLSQGEPLILNRSRRTRNRGRRIKRRSCFSPSDGRPQALACASRVTASLTSNLPGPSIFRLATLPFLTSIE